MTLEFDPPSMETPIAFLPMTLPRPAAPMVVKDVPLASRIPTPVLPRVVAEAASVPM
jgi:hypothetical protein